MALFLSFSDESYGEAQKSGVFVVAGFLTDQAVSSREFAATWTAEVLDSKPAIPHFHMTDMFSKQFRRQHCLSKAQAEAKIKSAARVMTAMGAKDMLCRYRLRLGSSTTTKRLRAYQCFAPAIACPERCSRTITPS